jgi:drug/metabolite transporter (DMT)-like permease
MSSSQSTHPHAPHFQLLPVLALAGAVVALGFSAIFVKWADAPGPVSGFYRVAVAALVMTLPFLGELRHERPASGGYIGWAVVAGLFFATDLALWNTSLNYTSAANATLLGNSAPVWVALGGALFFRERLPRQFWLGLVMSLAGMFIIVGRDFVAHPQLGVADMLALAAGFFYAGFFLTAQKARRGTTSLAAFWLAAVASAALLWLVTRAMGMPLTGYSTEQYLAMLAMALVTQVGAYLAINYALGHMSASVVSPTLLGQPVLTALLAVPLLGETLNGWQVAGGALVLAGIGVVHRAHRRHVDPDAILLTPDLLEVAEDQHP